MPRHDQFPESIRSAVPFGRLFLVVHTTISVCWCAQTLLALWTQLHKVGKNWLVRYAVICIFSVVLPKLCLFFQRQTAVGCWIIWRGVELVFQRSAPHSWTTFFLFFTVLFAGFLPGFSVCRKLPRRCGSSGLKNGPRIVPGRGELHQGGKTQRATGRGDREPPVDVRDHHWTEPFHLTQLKSIFSLFFLFFCCRKKSFFFLFLFLLFLNCIDCLQNYELGKSLKTDSTI